MQNVNAAKDSIKALVRGGYDLQKLRIQMGNRVVANVKARLGQKPGMPEEELDEESKEILKDVRARYRKIMDAYKKPPKPSEFTGDEVISSFTELSLISTYLEAEKLETDNFNRVEKALADFPIWKEFLEGVRGCGALMAGVIISEINIHAARHPSSLWKYAGLDVAQDGQGRSRRKEHQVEVEYVNKDGDPAKRVGITFNPFLKTKLYVLSDCFIKSRSPYRQCYDDYKHRLANHEKYGEHNDKKKGEDGIRTSKGRRDAMARRYMIKQFLKDLYAKWRTLEGLPVSLPYEEAKLAMKHGGEAA